MGPMAPNGNPHSIYQPLAAVTQPGPIYVSNMATLRRQNVQLANVSMAAHHHQQQQQLQQQQQQQQLQHQQHQQHQQQQQQQQMHQIKSPQESIEVPNSNSIDSAMYERDKQIYKCSTLRQGGKFDPKYKPSILNCPLPEIPKDESSPKHESIHQQQLKQQQLQQQQQQQQLQQNFSKTLQRPPMKLPSHMKMIPPPRIETPTSPPQPKTTTTTTTTPMLQLLNNGGAPQVQTTVIDESVLPPPPPSTQTAASSGGTHTVSKIANEMSMHIANSISSNAPITDDTDDLPPPPPPAITDESNYAVTEL